MSLHNILLHNKQVGPHINDAFCYTTNKLALTLVSSDAAGTQVCYYWCSAIGEEQDRLRVIAPLPVILAGGISKATVEILLEC